MPIGTITMVLANVGLQIYNNWCGNRQNEQLRQKREEFEQAALERNTQRMWQIMREGQTLTLELEEQRHQQRLKDLQGEVDNLLHSMAYSATINNWPLNVLPIVMKNQALGNLLARQEETVALHCILTPSNSHSFNTSVFPLIEEALETYCNQHWSIASDHPILFYSEAWKSNTHPTEVQIASMRTALSNLPTLLITPEFRPTDGKLVFQVRIWGVGVSSSDEFSIPEILPAEFQRDYIVTLDYAHDKELVSEVLEDLVPYLQCLIGYMADTYFWSSLGKVPVLPRLLADGSINTDGMSFLQEESVKYYIDLLEEQESNFEFNSIIDYVGVLYSIIPEENVQRLISIFTKKIAENMFFVIDENASLKNLIVKFDLYKVLPLDSYPLINKFVEIESKSYLIDKCQTKDVIKAEMNSKDYSQKKEELQGLLSNILKIKELPTDFRENFENTARKINADQFNIALIGEFQCGKTTTLDALCGGREISPRGNNIKTSACRIVITNIPQNEEEYATVVWKTNAELVQTISPILENIENEEWGYNPDSKDIFILSEYVNLNNHKHIDLIKRAIDQNINNNDMYDIIIIARFIVEFYSKISTFTRKDYYSIDEARKMMVFPQNMINRVNDNEGSVSCFSFDEALFVFIQTINCYIHSKDLEKLGCSVIDCPGLFASDYDTSIAIQTINSADAVLYLLNGEKQMGQSDKKAISEILKIGRFQKAEYDGDNIFFAINQRKSDEETAFVDTDLSELNRIGFKKSELHCFNAFLFYYAKFGKKYIESGMDEYSLLKFLSPGGKSIVKEGKEYFEITSKGERKEINIENRWKKDVFRSMLSLHLDDDNEITALDENNINILLSLSKADVLFSKIEDYIVATKAYSILIDNGAIKIKNGLIAIERILKNKEDSAMKDLQQRAAEYKRAQNDLEVFQAEAKSIIAQSFPKDIQKDYIDKVYAEYFVREEVVDQISFDATIALIDYVKKGATKWTAFKRAVHFRKNKQDDKMKAEIGQIIKNAFAKSFKPLIEKWVGLAYTNKDSQMESTLNKEAERLADEVKKRWETASQSSPILESVSSINTTIKISDTINNQLGINTNVYTDFVDKTSDLAINKTLNNIIVNILSVVIGTIVAIVIDMVFFLGVGTLSGILTAIIAKAIGSDYGKKQNVNDLSKKERELYDILNGNLYKALNKKSTKEEICYSDKGLVSVAKDIAERFKGFYINQLKPQQTKLEGFIASREQEYSKQQDKLKDIAQQAKHVREKQIEPILKKLETFINGISK